MLVFSARRVARFREQVTRFEKHAATSGAVAAREGAHPRPKKHAPKSGAVAAREGAVPKAQEARTRVRSRRTREGARHCGGTGPVSFAA
jgi:hypothetical protein